MTESTEVFLCLFASLEKGMVMWELVLKTMVAGGQRDVFEPTADILNKGILEAVKYTNLPQMRPSHLLSPPFLSISHLFLAEMSCYCT